MTCHSAVCMLTVIERLNVPEGNTPAIRRCRDSTRLFRLRCPAAVSLVLCQLIEIDIVKGLPEGQSSLVSTLPTDWIFLLLYNPITRMICVILLYLLIIDAILLVFAQ